MVKRPNMWHTFAYTALEQMQGNNWNGIPAAHLLFRLCLCVTWGCFMIIPSVRVAHHPRDALPIEIQILNPAEQVLYCMGCLFETTDRLPCEVHELADVWVRFANISYQELCVAITAARLELPVGSGAPAPRNDPV